MPYRLIVLDRDGVINADRDDFVKSLAEFQLLPGSIDAIARLKQAGYRVAIATNQSGLARGFFSLDVLDSMHAKLASLLAEKGAILDYIALCPHGPDDACACRKPKPGLLLEIGAALHIDPKDTLFIGDSLRDYEAAAALNMSFALVETGKGERTLTRHPELKQQIPIFADLSAAVDRLLLQPEHLFAAHPRA